MNYYAEIVTIGDEILIGQVLDSNTQWISQKLTDLGIKVIRTRSVSDNASAIIRALDNALNDTDLIFITGGLGPTKDDITKVTLAKYFDTPLEKKQSRFNELKAYYKKRGKELNELNKTQAILPKDCFIVPNEVGTAAGMWFEKDGRHIISMPGVPYEMKKMMEDTILPRISKLYELPSIYFKTIKTAGIPESDLALKIANWEDTLPAELSLAYLPSLRGVRLRLTGVHDDLPFLKKLVEDQKNKLKEILGEYIFGEDHDTLESLLGNILKNKQKTIGTAESCTGGAVAERITAIPGSSAYYKGSIVAYSNEVKVNQLNVPKETIEKYGAVSEEVVRLMANNVRNILKVDVGIACTGIAGPDGGTEEKPVGTVWIAYSDEKETISKRLNLTSLRANNIELTTTYLLDLTRKQLSKTN